MPENSHEWEMTALEGELGRLAPCAVNLDRDRCMFQAGWHAARRYQWVVRGVTALLASAATLAAVLLVYHPETRIVHVSPPEVPVPLSSSPNPPGATLVDDAQWQHYAESLRLRNDILNRGLDALPPLSVEEEPSKPISIDRLLQ